MQEQILFSAAFLLLLVGMVCVYKVPERLSLLKSVVICCMTELCIDSVFAGIFDIIRIPINLFSMGIVFLVLGVLLWGWIIYQHKWQRVAVCAMDLYAFLVITVFFGWIFYKAFTPEIYLSYTNTDPANHFSMAKVVMEDQTVGRMYFAPLYNGLIMELLQPLLVEINLYKAFIVADSLFNYLNILIFYVLLSVVLQSKLLKAASPFICILYFLGWPLYSYVGGGFVYFGIGVTIFAYVIYLLVQLKDSDDHFNKKILLGLIGIGIYNLAVCYMLFVPILCVIVACCLYYLIKRDKIIIPKKWIIGVASVILLFGVVLFVVCFFGFFGGDFGKIISGLKTEGGIHKQLYEDFLFLLPPAIYMLWYHYKQKRMDVIILTTAAVMGMVVVSFIACALMLMSGYYYYKFYYLLWFFIWLACMEAAEYALKESRVLVYSYAIPILLAIVCVWTGAVGHMADGNFVNLNTSSVFPIYEVSKRSVLEQNKSDLIDKAALINMSGYVNDHIQNAKQKPMLVVSYEKSYLAAWYRVFTGCGSRMAQQDTLTEVLEAIKKEGGSYFVIQKNGGYYGGNEEVLEDYESVYNNDYYELFMMK